MIPATSDLFVDTAGWASLFDQSQIYHPSSLVVYQDVRQRGRRIVTTNYVVAELVSLFLSPLHFAHQAIVRYINDIEESLLVEVIHVDRSLHKQAWRLFVARPDKQWSLVDCSSFVVMQERGITEALTTDHHFEQAGFVRLLK